MAYPLEVMSVFGADECGDGVANRSGPVALLGSVAKPTHIAEHAGQGISADGGKATMRTVP
jgi:hypothetical protein